MLKMNFAFYQSREGMVYKTLITSKRTYPRELALHTYGIEGTDKVKIHDEWKGIYIPIFETAKYKFADFERTSTI